MRAWEDFLNRQEENLGKQVVDKWLRPLKVIHFDSGNLYLEAKDSFQILWFEEHIRPLLKSSLVNNNFRPIKTHLTLQETVTSVAAKSKKKLNGNTNAPLQLHPDPLDPCMTLENFVVGKSNQILFQFFCELTGFDSSLQQFDPPTTLLGAFNPIYVWGHPGCGKTHLLMALAHALKKKGLISLYARAETFTEHFVAAIRSSEMQTFRRAYRHVDVLLVDDVHLFARKNATQEEFFHTFNALHTMGKQIILSSSYAPYLLKEIEPRLVSRFEWGINLHFDTLEKNEREEVLKKREEALHFPLSKEVRHFLLKTFDSNKSLHRALEALILHCHLEEDARFKRNSETLHCSRVEQMLGNLILQEQATLLSPEKIISVVSAYYEIRSEDLLGKSQSQDHSLPRQIAMYLCRRELKLPFMKIGRTFNRDHSTVMTSIRQIQKRIDGPDKELTPILMEIRRRIES